MTRQLHDLLDSASVSQVPDGLAGAAVAGARRRRRHRFELGAALALVVLLVAPVGWVAMRNSSDSEQSPAPVMSSVGLPAQLPDAIGLPMLADAPMEAASVVYLDDSNVVAVDAKTGSAAYVYPNIPGNGVAADYQPAERAYLSPDGQKVILTFGALLKPLLIDLSTGDRTTLTDIWLPRGQTRFAPASEIAWSPSSNAFACICSGDKTERPAVWVLELAQMEPDGSFPSTSGPGISADQLSWGDGGLATQAKEPLMLPGAAGRWVFSQEGAPGGPTDLGRADYLTLARGNAFNEGMLGLHNAAPVPYLAVRYPVGVVMDPVAECWVGWSGTVSSTGDSYRGSCDAVAVGAAGDGFVMTMASGEVQVVGVVGQPQTVSQLPKGATSPSFAADLLTQPEPAPDLSPKPTPSVPPADAFPTAEGLPSWQELPIEQAAAAYVSDGRLVLVDAETGQGAVADLDVGSRDKLLVSPDGRRLLWIQVPGGSAGAPVDSAMVLIDLASRTQVPLDAEVSASTGAAPEASIAAWMDDNALYCLCGETAGGNDVRAPVNLLLSPDGEVSRVDQVSGFDQAGAPEVDAITFGAAPGPAVHLAAGADLTQGWYWATTADTWRTWQDQVWWQADDVAMGATSLALLERRDGVWEVTIEDLYGEGMLARMPLPNIDEPFLTSATGGGFGVVMGSDGVQELLYISDDGAVTSTVRPFAEPVAKLTVAGDWLARQAPR